MDPADPPRDLDRQSSSAAAEAGLADIQILGPRVSLYTPTTTTTTTTPPPPRRDSPQEHCLPPDLVVMCSWMGAQLRHIQKYTDAYRARYPTTPLLLLRQDGGDFFWRTQAERTRNLEPALATIRALEDRTSSEFGVLLHLFSNGGSYTACDLADAYLASCPDKPQLLPVSALVLDSTPSLPSLNAAHRAICSLLPKSQPAHALGSAAVWLFVHLVSAWDRVTGREDTVLWLRRRLNDTQGAFMQAAVKRVYIYSNADELIPPEAVERHAAEASAIGGKDRVQLQNFVTSRHVGHAMVDQARYWRVIQQLWEETMQSI